MRIETNCNNLLTALSTVEKALPGRISMPILDGVYMNKQADTLTLAAYDLDIAVKAQMEVGGEGDGSIILNRKIIPIVRQLSAETVDIRIENMKAYIKSGNAEFTLMCMDAEDFPVVIADDYNSWRKIELPTETFKEIINKIAFCVSKEAGRPIFQSILVTYDGSNDLQFIGTDTYRLAQYTSKDLLSIGEPFELLVPGKNLQSIAKILNDETINIHIGEKECIFACGDITAMSRLTDGQFPNIGAIFPDRNKTKISINKDALNGMLLRAETVIQGSQSVVAVSLKGNTIIISANSETGNIREEAHCEIEGEELDRVLFNVKYLLDGCKAIDDDILTIHFNGEIGPVIMESDNYRYLMLPIKKD